MAEDSRDPASLSRGFGAAARTPLALALTALLAFSAPALAQTTSTADGSTTGRPTAATSESSGSTGGGAESEGSSASSSSRGGAVAGVAPSWVLCPPAGAGDANPLLTGSGLSCAP